MQQAKRGARKMGETLLVIVLGAALYFLPGIVAMTRKTENSGAVIVINVFLGWTLLGWVVALAMAAGGKRRQEPVNHQQTTGEPR